MPARVMPTGGAPSYMNPAGDHDDATKKRQQMSELTVCISLASLFDFQKSGFISQENWQKGMATLMMDELGTDPKIWEKLVGMHGSRDAGKGRLDLQRLTDVVPIDPRVSVLLNAIVKGLVGMRDFIHRSMRKETKEVELKTHRAIINIRRRITYPVLVAWRDYTRECRKIFKKAAYHMRHNAFGKAWRTWVANVEDLRYEAMERKAQERKMRRVKASAMRMMHSKVVGSWNTWVEMWTERKKFVKVRAPRHATPRQTDGQQLVPAPARARRERRSPA
jgi:hypothetical protein